MDTDISGILIMTCITVNTILIAELQPQIGRSEQISIQSP